MFLYKLFYAISILRELSDQDKDGFLKVGEFCVAMHLVVLKKNGLIIPRVLPPELLPYMSLVSVNGENI